METGHSSSTTTLEQTAPGEVPAMEAVQGYTYQDNSDQKSEVMKEEFPNWERSESRILRRIQKQMKQHLNVGNSFMLDAGCGQGRLLPVFAPLVAGMTGVEPDRERYSVSRRLIDDRGLSGKVKLHNIKIQELEEAVQYDAILCSHVLQHVSTESFDRIVSKLKAVLKKKGLLFLTVSHSTIDHEYFEIVHTTTQENSWDIVSKDQFNQAAGSLDLLPIRHFTIDNMKSFLPEFEIIDYRVFHVYPMWWASETIINRYPSLQSMHGTDLFIAARFKS